MAFKLNVEKTGKGAGTKSDVDWDALTEHIVAQCKAVKPRSIPGIISGIIDLGIQQPEPYDGPVKAEAKYPDNAEYYTSEKGEKMVRYERKPVQQVAVTVDFPQITVDYGKFFNGESNPVPYRMLLNGEYSLKDKEGNWNRVVGRGFSTQETRHDSGVWALSKLNILHKLAEAAGLLDDAGYFKAPRIGELLGQAAQFQLNVTMVEKNGKRYLNEKIKLAGIIPEGLPVPELDESLLYGINMNGENDPEAVRILRKSIKNTVARASNYPGSDLQRMIEGGTSEKPKEETEVEEEEEIIDDDDLPF